jgi:hypothetical protein
MACYKDSFTLFALPVYVRDVRSAGQSRAKVCRSSSTQNSGTEQRKERQHSYELSLEPSDFNQLQ